MAEIRHFLKYWYTYLLNCDYRDLCHQLAGGVVGNESENGFTI